ncbi:hypothetical protein DV515_00013666, partial [Chloebia gouldiae]
QQGWEDALWTPGGGLPGLLRVLRCAVFQILPCSYTADHQLHRIPDLALWVFQRMISCDWSMLRICPNLFAMQKNSACLPKHNLEHFSSFPNVKRLAICLDPPPTKAARKRFFGKGKEI